MIFKQALLNRYRHNKLSASTSLLRSRNTRRYKKLCNSRSASSINFFSGSTSIKGNRVVSRSRARRGTY